MHDYHHNSLVHKINTPRETSSYVQQLEDMDKKPDDGRDNTMSIGM